MLSMVFCTAMVSGTISSSRIFTPGSLASVAASRGSVVVSWLGPTETSPWSAAARVGDVAARPRSTSRE